MHFTNEWKNQNKTKTKTITIKPFENYLTMAINVVF